MRPHLPTLRVPRGFSAPALLAFLAVIALVALVPQLSRKPTLLHLWIMVFLAIAQGSAWNVVGGYAGQYSVGHAAYFGFGAYITMILLEMHQVAPWYGIGLAVAGAVVLSVIIGSITFRLRGPYFVLASIAMAEIIRLAALHFKDLTRGAEGILLNAIPPLITPWFTVRFIGKLPFFYASLGLAVIAVSANWLVQHTKLGYTFQAIREDQDAAHSLGINPTLHKSLALAISAALTGAAGSVFALYVRFIDPNIVFSLPDVSVQMVLICIIGGIGTILGPVVGAVVMVLLGETLRSPKWLVQVGLLGDESPVVAFIEQRLSNAHVLFYGVLVVLVVLFAPDGFLGLLRTAVARVKKRLAARRAPPDQPAAAAG
jgi:branched-chain amino acid transport system permease protein